MGDTSITGLDTVQIDGRIFNDLADGTPFEIEYPEPFGMMKVGKNNNAIYAKNSNGIKADVTIRVLIGSSDDQYLLGRMAQWNADESSFVLMTSMFVKRIGDGAGNVQSKVYNMIGGYFSSGVAARTVAEGDTEQSVAVYKMQFLAVPASIQG